MKTKRTYKVNDPRLWRHMAKGFTRAAQNQNAHRSNFPFGMGVCFALSTLTGRPLNYWWVQHNRLCFLEPGGYLWGLSRSGRLARAEFCAGMAERIEAGEHFNWPSL